MFPVPVEVWGSASPPASQLRLKEARREHLLRSHGISRYSDIIQQDLHRWREMGNSPKFSSLPSALEEEEREREIQKNLQSHRRRVASGSNGTKTKVKDIWKKIIPSIFGGGKQKSRDKFPSESDILDDSSGSSGSPSMKEPEKSILMAARMARRERSASDAPKKVVRWADESEDLEGRSPRTLNLSTIDEEGYISLHPRSPVEEIEEPDAFLELDEDDSPTPDQIDRHPDTWPPHPGLMCANALSSYSDSELTRHSTAGCPFCDERQAILANLRSPDAGFHSPESAAVSQPSSSSSSSSRSAAESAAAAMALSTAASLPQSSLLASSLANPASSDSPSSFLPSKLPRLASTPSLLPSQLELSGTTTLVICPTGVRHRASASVRYSTTHTVVHP